MSYHSAFLKQQPPETQVTGTRHPQRSPGQREEAGPEKTQSTAQTSQRHTLNPAHGTSVRCPKCTGNSHRKRQECHEEEILHPAHMFEWKASTKITNTKRPLHLHGELTSRCGGPARVHSHCLASLQTSESPPTGRWPASTPLPGTVPGHACPT